MTKTTTIMLNGIDVTYTPQFLSSFSDYIPQYSLIHRITLPEYPLIGSTPQVYLNFVFCR